MKIHRDLIQGTDEWLAVRAGKITSTAGKPLLQVGKEEMGFGKGAITELYKILDERLSGEPRDSFGGSKATEFGHESEGLGRLEYERRNFVKVEEVGFISKTDFIGTSPDGIMEKMKRGFEGKSLPVEHIRIKDTNKPVDAHVFQCQWNLWCTGWDDWDLVYHSPRLPKSCNYVEFNLKPDLALHAKLDEVTSKFIILLDDKFIKHTALNES